MDKRPDGDYVLRASPTGKPDPVLEADSILLGDGCTGTFTHEAGTCTTTDDLFLGTQPGSLGAYNQSGGTLTVGRDYLLGCASGAAGTADQAGEVGPMFPEFPAPDVAGTLAITGAAAELYVWERLVLTPGATLTAVPGATIHMAGAHFENESADTGALSGLGDLTLVFEGGAGVLDTMEVASAPGGGFVANFALLGLGLVGVLARRRRA